MSCIPLWECVRSCGDLGCKSDCEHMASDSALVAFDAMYACLSKACPPGTAFITQCQFDAQTDQGVCVPEAEACRNDGA